MGRTKTLWARWLWRIPMMWLAVGAAGGCLPTDEKARLLKENDRLRGQVSGLERTVDHREATIDELQQQVDELHGFDPSRPTDLFAPASLEIVSMSGGANYDDQPGDDGITVYLRLRDRDGDAVKAPGRIAVQLLDNRNLAQPRAIGFYQFDDAETLRQAWYGPFGTQHYTLKCPFPPDATMPGSGKLNMSVDFVDFLTGRTLTATKEVTYRGKRP